MNSEYRQNSRQNQLSVDKFHYLNVSRIDMITLYDDFECILKCLDRSSLRFCELCRQRKKVVCVIVMWQVQQPWKTQRKQEFAWLFVSKCITISIPNASTCYRWKELALFKGDRGQLPGASRDEINFHRHISLMLISYE